MAGANVRFRSCSLPDARRVSDPFGPRVAISRPLRAPIPYTARRMIGRVSDRRATSLNPARRNTLSKPVQA